MKIVKRARTILEIDRLGYQGKQQFRDICIGWSEVEFVRTTEQFEDTTIPGYLHRMVRVVRTGDRVRSLSRGVRCGCVWRITSIFFHFWIQIKLR